MTKHLIASKQLYYFAIVSPRSHRVVDAPKQTACSEQISNTVIRFSWIMFLSPQGPPPLVKSFIVAMLEMLRRWQWNFRKLPPLIIHR